jgi:glycosyltransferase involved in cell wall biosynthesis
MSAEILVHYLSQNRGLTMGMGLYERLLIKNLLEQNHSSLVADVMFDGRRPKSENAGSCFPPNIRTINFLGFSAAHFASLPWPLVKVLTSLLLPSGAKQSTLFHSLALSFPTSSRLPQIYTIHDLAPTKFSDEGELPTWSKVAANDAQAIITPSEFGKAEIVRELGVAPEKVHVVLNGCEHELFNTTVKPLNHEEHTALGLPAKFVFYAGGATRRKNVIALLQAWGSICVDFPELHLVFCGPQEQLRELVSRSESPRLVVLGYVERQLLPRIMKSATAVVCPSIYEGFGLPPLEAMALGVPTIGTRAGGAVPEVMGDAGYLAEDGSAEALATALRTVLFDLQLMDKLKDLGPKRALQFSWTEHARQVLMIYRNVLSLSK